MLQFKDFEYQIEQLRQVIRTYREMAGFFNKHQMYTLEGRIRSSIEASENILEDLLKIKQDVEHA